MGVSSIIIRVTFPRGKLKLTQQYMGEMCVCASGMCILYFKFLCSNWTAQTEFHCICKDLDHGFEAKANAEIH